MSHPIRLAISTCPNDTFTFHALLEKQVDWRGLDFQIELMDIQQLNDRLFAGSYDVAKGSFHAALLLSDSLVVLPSGSALGFGVGPLLLSSRPGQNPPVQNHPVQNHPVQNHPVQNHPVQNHPVQNPPVHTQPAIDHPVSRNAAPVGTVDNLVLCPGSHTTATLLLRMFFPELQNIEQVVFSDIMPRLQNGSADFGVCIHEGRFTWQDQGLGLVADLGTLWEQKTKCPLPLGGVLAKKTLPSDMLWTVQQVIQDSLQHALAQPESAFPTMRRHAQEFDDDVLMRHVDLYVNDWTVQLGPTGTRSLEELNRRAKEAGIIPVDQTGLQILQPPV